MRLMRMFKSDRCGIEMIAAAAAPVRGIGFKSDRCGIEIAIADMYHRGYVRSNQTVAGLK